MSKAWLGGMAALAVTLLIALFILQPRPADPIELQSGTVLLPLRPVAGFDLLNQHGTAFTQAEFAGHWSLVFAGFTECPDICPTTLTTLNRVYDSLGSRRDNLQLVLLTVDPERDTQEKLARYLEFFNPEFVGVTGEPAQLQILYDSLGVKRIRIPGARGIYSVDHSASLLLVSPGGQLAGYFMPPFSVTQLTADLASVLDRKN